MKPPTRLHQIFEVDEIEIKPSTSKFEVAVRVRDIDRNGQPYVTVALSLYKHSNIVLHPNLTVDIRTRDVRGSYQPKHNPKHPDSMVLPGVIVRRTSTLKTVAKRRSER